VNGPHVAIVVENVALGVDTRLRKQVDTLLEHGCRVSVVTMRHDDNAPYRARAGLRVLEYAAAPDGTGTLGYVREYAVAFLRSSWLLVRLRLRHRIDVLQLCQPPDVFFPVAWLLRLTGARIVVDQRDLMPETLASRTARPSRLLTAALRVLERESRRVAHHTITVNGFLERRLEEVAPGAPVTVVMNGPVLARADRARFDPTLRRGEQFLVVWAGKIGPQDRVDLVVRLAEEVVHRRGRDDCRFVVLGDGECVEQMQELTRELGLEDHVGFPGWLPEEQVFAYLATADLGVDTSLQQEVSPVKAMEYFALGLPLVCFDLQETRLLAGEAAELVPPGDVPALATAVLGVLDDPARRLLMGRCGRAIVERRTAWERQVPRYLAAVGPDGTGLPSAGPSGTPLRSSDGAAGEAGAAAGAAAPSGRRHRAATPG
jgi:glycosyltransferase involved in cell wall biosynthesis